MNIKCINHKDPLLDEVALLGKQNAKTLGMFPLGAFKDHARKNWIMTATDNGKLAGYVLFRISQRTQILSITHLCVQPDYRKNGVAKALLDSVKEKYAHSAKGMFLSCREDYEGPCKFWEKYGFKAVKKVLSRSREEKYLIKWWYDFGKSDLFSQEVVTVNKVRALLDSNIIIKLRDEPNYDDIEALSLTADWLEDDVDYFFAPEIYNEINRDSNKDRAKATLQFLGYYSEARFDPQDRDSIYASVSEKIPSNSTNDVSDKKQISECIASKIDYFLTMDANILNNSEFFFDNYKLKVLRPLEFILYIDQIKNGDDYNAFRMTSLDYEYKKIKSDDVDQLVSIFLNEKGGEKKFQFRNTISTVAADLKNSIIKVISQQRKFIGFFASIIGGDSLTVKAIRVIDNKISRILFQQLVNDNIGLAIQYKKQILFIEEKELSPEYLIILDSFGFEKRGDKWIKVVIEGQYSTEELLSKFEVVKKIWPVSDLLNEMQGLQGEKLVNFKLNLEKKAWPIKLTDIEMPTYIIPIKAVWSSQLFDFLSSDQSLFGAKPELVWSKENIYYRSVKPVMERTPARILWYVSKSYESPVGRHSGIVGCSYLNEVSVGPAKSLYKKFKNFGIYEWNHIFQLAKNDANKDIKALRFSDTEVFKKTISYKYICKVMNKFQRLDNTFASPVEVSSSIFNELYKLRQ